MEQEFSRPYIPAAGNHWSLPLYDPVVKLIGADAARRTLLDSAALQPKHRVLDIGCGTGSFAVLIKRHHPEVEVVGLDPDPKALGRARHKAERESLRIEFDRGYADDLPYPSASIDRVLSTLMFHHLERDVKEGMLREVRRVLKPGGVFCLLDFAGPEAGARGFLMHLMHSSKVLRDNDVDRVLALMREAGFADSRRVRQGTMFFGCAGINYFHATVP
jgi:ubiquinone/menaquinone biosynthesis C-methylase UbiE